ncbi:uncharacterized protein LOC120625024 [Pararge aegeria]|uniref:uncharacterized protein LOC120625024 n=1 Tax=Pararge aegeria TaxID=116150 RepID=UPI0019D085F1|nr:uncharacterized protein LOC120625024 [Pararge aegeria]
MQNSNTIIAHLLSPIQENDEDVEVSESHSLVENTDPSATTSSEVLFPEAVRRRRSSGLSDIFPIKRTRYSDPQEYTASPSGLVKQRIIGEGSIQSTPKDTDSSKFRSQATISNDDDYSMSASENNDDDVGDHNYMTESINNGCHEEMEKNKADRLAKPIVLSPILAGVSAFLPIKSPIISHHTVCSSLPELTIVVEKKRLDDDLEEFYDCLEKTMRILYKKYILQTNYETSSVDSGVQKYENEYFDGDYLRYDDDDKRDNGNKECSNEDYVDRNISEGISKMTVLSPMQDNEKDREDVAIPVSDRLPGTNNDGINYACDIDIGLHQEVEWAKSRQLTKSSDAQEADNECDGGDYYEDLDCDYDTVQQDHEECNIESSHDQEAKIHRLDRFTKPKGLSTILEVEEIESLHEQRSEDSQGGGISLHSPKVDSIGSHISLNSTFDAGEVKTDTNNGSSGEEVEQVSNILVKKYDLSGMLAASPNFSVDSLVEDEDVREKSFGSIEEEQPVSNSLVETIGGF